MNEEMLIEKLGMVTSSTIQSFLDKSLVNTCKHLKRLEKFDILTIEEFHHDHGIRKIYIKNEIHQDIFTD